MQPIFLFLFTMIPGTLLLGFYDVGMKKLLLRGLGEQVLLGVGFSGAGLLLLFALPFFGIPSIAPAFWGAFFTASVLNLFGQFAWYRAFKYGEVSFIAPLRVLTPILIIATGFLFLSEAPSQNGFLGIALTLVGLLLLLGFQGGAFFSSLKASFTSKGFLWGIFAVFAFSFSFPLEKKAILASSTLLFSACMFLLVGVVSAFLSFLFDREKTRNGLRLVSRHKGFVFGWILALAGGGFLVNHALNFTLAVYAASVKRLQALWGVLLGGAFLKEGNILFKVTATLIMLSGIAITVIFG